MKALELELQNNRTDLRAAKERLRSHIEYIESLRSRLKQAEDTLEDEQQEFFNQASKAYETISKMKGVMDIYTGIFISEL